MSSEDKARQAIWRAPLVQSQYMDGRGRVPEPHCRGEGRTALGALCRFRLTGQQFILTQDGPSPAGSRGECTSAPSQIIAPDAVQGDDLLQPPVYRKAVDILVLLFTRSPQSQAAHPRILS
jgi:hypothetical protein